MPRMARENDLVDRRLVSLLQANARESTANLGRKLGIARTTVQERITRLQRNGTISGYSVVLRRDPLERYAEALVLLSAVQRRQKAVSAALRDFPEVKLCQSVSGDFELLCRIRVVQLEDVYPVIAAMADIPGVERVKSIIVLATDFDRTHAETVSTASVQAGKLGQGEAG